MINSTFVYLKNSSSTLNNCRHSVQLATWPESLKALPKTILVLLSVLVLAQTRSFSQPSKDFLTSTSTPMVYLGIDFTKAKVIDDLTASAEDIRERQFAGINEVIINEPKKYDLTRALRRSNIDHDLSQVQKKNEKINADQIMSGNGSDLSRLKAADITALVNGYDFGGKTGTGLLFVMEAMSKRAKVAAIWVTFIDMKSKKVLLTERMEGKTGMGFGFRNFWAMAIHSVIETIDKKKYKEWTKS